jgi:hypothetical protein
MLSVILIPCALLFSCSRHYTQLEGEEEHVFSCQAEICFEVCFCLRMGHNTSHHIRLHVGDS